MSYFFYNFIKSLFVIKIKYYYFLINLKGEALGFKCDEVNYKICQKLKGIVFNIYL